jgi:hypothetical protein
VEKSTSFKSYPRSDNTLIKASNTNHKNEDEVTKMALAHQVTCWSSTFLLLSRLLKMKDFCLRASQEKEFKIISLPNETWEEIENLVITLTSKLTVELQAQSLLIPDFILAWFEAKNASENVGSEFASQLIECI